jgi:AraC-like DNA-binding protein
VEPTQALLLRPGLRHGGLQPYSPDLHFYWAHFRLHTPSIRETPISVPKLCTIRDPEGLTELFRRFLSDQESDLRDPLSAAQVLCLIICVITDSRERFRRTRPPVESGIAEKVQSIIARSYRERISTSSIARTVHYNPDYLERIFRRETGMSIVDAIHQKRLSAARLVLRNDAEKNINEVAYECGFKTRTYFCQMFRRFSGFTPRDFRNLYSRTHINTH